MIKGLKVDMAQDDSEQKLRLIVTIDYALIKNENFLEVMGSYQLSDPASWLNALADFILRTQGDQNGQG